ncbi:hypothetical protein ABAC460_14075 [Asticcacaulis sp. AC460]|nr:hypothetical protein ABAC460_14075 [Asticcacaulis sp. AC460]
MNVEFIANGYVAPLTQLQLHGAVRGHFDGGAYYADGEVCQAGLHQKDGYDNTPLPIDRSAVEARLEGSHVFGGMLQNKHFGHFLVESLSRLWAFSFLSRDYASVVYYNRIAHMDASSFIPAVLDVLCPGVRLIMVKQPTLVEHLAVPTTIARAGVIQGHPSMAGLLAPARALRGEGHRKIYVSRSRLNPFDGMILGEGFIERSLAAEGYHIVYPETLSIREQFALYNDADTVIFADGSAAHLYALVARADQKLFIIWRRKLNYTYVRQIESFGGPTAQGTSTIEELFVPSHAPWGVFAQAKGRPNFDNLKAQLLQGGFITGDGWQAPTETDIQDQLADVEKILNVKLVSTNTLPDLKLVRPKARQE